MKLSTRAFSVLSLVSLAILFSCGGGGGSDAAPEKGQLNKLSKTWVLASRTDYTFNGNEFDEPGGSAQLDADFSITFSGTFDSDQPEGPYDFDVTGTGTPSPLPATGEWVFASVDGNEGQIVLDGELPVSYSISSSGDLTLTFTCIDCNYAGARAASVDGAWVINLVPEN